MSALERHLTARQQRTLPRSLFDAISRIERDRRVVDTLLSLKSTPPIYGFNTLLGPLDKSPASRSDQARLLDAHLIGRLIPAPAELLADATLVKLAQLSGGGSGISPKTYDALLRAAFREATPEGAWWDSYSSGDVVPAAWWVVAALGRGAIQHFAAGDLIALINGNFFSTAASIGALVSLIDVHAEILARAARIAHPPVVDLRIPASLLAALAADSLPSQPDRAQAPVSLRDFGPIAAGAVASSEVLARAIETRLSTPSANPYFTFGGDGAQAHSQSSFLDIRLTMALHAAQTALAFSLSALQRFSEHTSARGVARHASAAELVQPPKVSMAILNEALLSGAEPRVPAVAESGGVEDLADGSLSSAKRILDLVVTARDMLRLYDQLVSPGQAPPDITAKHVRRELTSAAIAASRG